MKYLLCLLLMFSTVFGEKISDLEIKLFEKEMHEIFWKDHTKIKENSSIEGFLKRVFKGVSISDETFKDFKNRLTKKNPFEAYLSNLPKLLTEGSEIKKVLLRHTSEGCEVTYRISFEDLSITLITFSLRKEDGIVEIVDVLDYSEGAPRSAILRPVYLQAATYVDKSLLKRLVSSDKGLIDDFKKIPLLATALNSQKYSEALKLCNSFNSHELKDSIYLYSVKTTIYNGLEDYKKLDKNLQEMKSKFPEVELLDFIYIDIHLENEEYSKLLLKLDNLQKIFKKDAHLEAYKALATFLLKEELKYLKHFLNKAKKLDSKSMLPYYFEFRFYARNKETFKDLYYSLKGFKQAFKKGYKPVKTSEDFAEFRKSKYYKAYLKLLAKK